jgi:hypothetical protein
MNLARFPKFVTKCGYIGLGSARPVQTSHYFNETMICRKDCVWSRLRGGGCSSHSSGGTGRMGNNGIRDGDRNDLQFAKHEYGSPTHVHLSSLTLFAVAGGAGGWGETG